MAKTKEENAAVRQEVNRRRLKRLMLRMASLEFSAPLKAAINRYEISPEYRRIELVSSNWFRFIETRKSLRSLSRSVAVLQLG